MERKIVAGSHPETGLVLSVDSKNEEMMVMRIDQISVELDGVFFQEKKRSLFIRGEAATMKKFFGTVKEGDSMAHVVKNIAYREQNKPYYKDQQPLINPKTNEEVTCGGFPIYREYYSSDVDTVNVKLNRDISTETKTINPEEIIAGVHSELSISGN